VITTSRIMLMRNDKAIPLEDFSASCRINGIKLKTETEDALGTRAYNLDDVVPPPYSILYYKPDISLSATVAWELWDMEDQFLATFRIEGLPWLPDPRVVLREVHIVSSGFAELTFAAMNPPVKPMERIDA